MGEDAFWLSKNGKKVISFHTRPSETSPAFFSQSKNTIKMTLLFFVEHMISKQIQKKTFDKPCKNATALKNFKELFQITFNKTVVLL